MNEEKKTNWAVIVCRTFCGAQGAPGSTHVCGISERNHLERMAKTRRSSRESAAAETEASEPTTKKSRKSAAAKPAPTEEREPEPEIDTESIDAPKPRPEAADEEQEDQKTTEVVPARRRSGKALALDPAYKFVLRFPNSTGIRSLVDIIRGVLGECHFRIGCDDNFKGIRIKSIDKGLVCGILARLECEVMTNGVEDFWVRCAGQASLEKIMRRIDHGSSVEFALPTGSSTIDIKSFLPSKGTRKSFQLSCLERSEQDFSVDQLHFDYTIEMDVSEFRDAIQTAADFDASDIRFRIFKERSKRGAPSKSPQSLKKLYLELSGHGLPTDTFCFLFPSVVASEDLGDDEDVAAAEASRRRSSDVTVFHTCASAAPEDMNIDLSTMDIGFDDVFSVRFLSLLIANVKQSKMTMRMAMDQPLMVRYSLGENSQIDFVVSPNVDDGKANDGGD